jgi:AcrR family transcriptional regulator
MSQANTSVKKKRAKRGPGRPSLQDGEPLSRLEIARRALNLCRREPLQDVSIVRIANELGVTPALIHYYVGGRERFTSSVMNCFYRQLVAKLPSVSTGWRADVTSVFDTIYANYIEFGGIVAYVMAHNRFRLFQLVDAGERDHGADFFERIAKSVRLARLAPQQTAMFAHLLLQHVLSSAHQHASRQLPEDHHAFLVSQLKRLSSEGTPNAHFLLESFASIRGEEAFSAGLDIIIDAMERAVNSQSTAPRSSKSLSNASARHSA